MDVATARTDKRRETNGEHDDRQRVTGNSGGLLSRWVYLDRRRWPTWILAVEATLVLAVLIVVGCAVLLVLLVPALINEWRKNEACNRSPSRLEQDVKNR